MKRLENRLIAIALVIVLVVTMVQVAPNGNDAAVSYAAEDSGDVVTRGVVTNLEQLPQYYDAEFLSKERGTEDRPFVVLEIVPYYQYAEFGFLISGCEHLNIAEMQLDGTIFGYNYLNYIESEQIYMPHFFTDEAEYETFLPYVGKREEVSKNTVDKVPGYYERVPDGTGNFQYNRFFVSGGDRIPVNLDLPVEDSVPVMTVPFVAGSSENVDQEEASASEEAAESETTTLASQENAEPEASLESQATTEPEASPESQATAEPEAAPADADGNDDEALLTLTMEIGSANGFVTGGDVNTSTDPGPMDNSGAGKSTDDEAPSILSDAAVLADDNEIAPVAEDDDTLVYKVSIDPADNGNLVWHSLGTNEVDKLKSNGISFVNDDDINDFTGVELPEIGQYIYAYRQASESDPCIYINSYSYCSYKNDDAFLVGTLHFTQEEAATYSIVVKTITPEELNGELRWIDYADLIVLRPQSSPLISGDPSDPNKDTWEKYNLLGKDYVPSSKRYGVNDDAFCHADKDISWQTALKMFYKVTADTDYAAIIIDDGIFNINTPKEPVKIYDWNLRDTGKMYSDGGVSDNNFYKLMVMLLSMDTNLFKQLYLSGDSPVIQTEVIGGKEVGVNTLQSGNAATSWGFHTFLLAQPNVYPNSWWDYWSTDEMWNNYGIALSRVTTVKKWVNGHVFAYPGDNSMLIAYLDEMFSSWDNTTNHKKMFDDFYSALTDEEKAAPQPSDAVRYILGLIKGKQKPTSSLENIRILDIEPSVALNSDYEPDWYLTETYIKMLVPSFRGTVEMVHQTTAEFIGRTEDLNSEYQMIFMGLDTSGYFTDTKTIDGMNVKVPVWKDTANLGTLIYTHMGDKLLSAERKTGDSNQNRSVKWIWTGNTSYDGTANSYDSTEIRLTGNDITRRKLKELDDFVNAGYPIIAEKFLYELNDKLIDPQSYIYQFVDHSKKTGKSIYSTDNLSGVQNAVSKIVNAVTFTQLPKQYSGKTTRDDNAVFVNQNYLDTESGRSYMDFRFTVQDSGYKYRIYVDQDLNFKFTDDEILLSGDASKDTENHIRHRIGATMVGVVQWKIEVYRADNESIRYVETGTSAVRNTSGEGKKINVLQIMPDRDSGRLNLQENQRFRSYYQNLVDYDITIRSITLAEFQQLFRGSDFSYDSSQETDGIDNPKNLDRIGTVSDSRVTGGQVALSEYNMFIIGFGDMYGGKDFTNYNGEVDYLQYFADQGKSILFTHDLTSMSVLPLDGRYMYGASANSLLRDLMGMNRYKAVSSTISSQYGVAKRNELVAYQNKQEEEAKASEGDRYSWVNSPSYNYDWLDSNKTKATHGFTYFAAARIAGSGSEYFYHNPNIDDTGATNWDSAVYEKESIVKYRLPYKYLIYKPDGKTRVWEPDDVARFTGLGDFNDITTRVIRLNEGQITVYPYEIGDSLEVSPTHGQWFQLNPEDEDVTVWYNLDMDHNIDMYKTDRNGNIDWGSVRWGDGSTIPYRASPNDGMNNYYIYSKGNIFYSGVGHSTLDSQGNLPHMETKLFVNTMVAAYNSSYEPPVVDVLNDEAIYEGGDTYSIELLQNFDTPETIGTNDYYANSSTFGPSDTYEIIISPFDFNVVTTQLKMTIFVDDGDDSTEPDKITVLKNANGTNVPVEDGAFIVENGKTYTFDYPLEYFLEGKREIKMNIRNNRVNADNTTTVNMSVQPLFPLD